MGNAFRVFVLSLVMIIPCNRIRIFVYRTVFKYKIGKNVRIGISYLNAKVVNIEDNCYLGNFNYISEVSHFYMHKSSVVGNYNKFLSKYRYAFSPKFILGHGSHITSNHFFDLIDDIIIGSNTTIAGWGSQFWTHTFSVDRQRIQAPISLNNNIYMGSSCIISLGSTIRDNIIVAAGSVVATTLDESHCVYAGVPARKIRSGVTADTMGNIEMLHKYNESTSYYRKLAVHEPR